MKSFLLVDKWTWQSYFRIFLQSPVLQVIEIVVWEILSKCKFFLKLDSSDSIVALLLLLSKQKSVA